MSFFSCILFSRLSSLVSFVVSFFLCQFSFLKIPLIFQHISIKAFLSVILIILYSTYRYRTVPAGYDTVPIYLINTIPWFSDRISYGRWWACSQLPATMARTPGLSWSTATSSFLSLPGTQHPTYLPTYLLRVMLKNRYLLIQNWWIVQDIYVQFNFWLFQTAAQHSFHSTLKNHEVVAFNPDPGTG